MATKRTRQELLILWLTEYGWVERPDLNTSTYRVFTNAGQYYRYFVGKTGALRFGRNISTSHSQTDRVNWKILKQKYA